MEGGYWVSGSPARVVRSFWLDGDVSDGLEVLLDVGDGGVGKPGHSG